MQLNIPESFHCHQRGLLQSGPKLNDETTQWKSRAPAVTAAGRIVFISVTRVATASPPPECYQLQPSEGCLLTPYIICAFVYSVLNTMQIPEPEMEIRPDSVTRFKLADNGQMQYLWCNSQIKYINMMNATMDTNPL
jgi:hypothetical protein